jgi:ABC-type uncharacterized transport system substrate-binding protein
LRSRPIFAAILALTVLASWAAVEAQPSVKIARIGFLDFGSREPGPGAARYAAFLEGLRELGCVEGKDLIVEPRFAQSKPERLPTLVEELLRLKVDAIVATGSPVYRVLQRTTTTLLVVVTVTADPVLEGLATSVARPAATLRT